MGDADLFFFFANIIFVFKLLWTFFFLDRLLDIIWKWEKKIVVFLFVFKMKGLDNQGRQQCSHVSSVKSQWQVLEVASPARDFGSTHVI